MTESAINTVPTHIPGAWHDLHGRVNSAAALVECIGEQLANHDLHGAKEVHIEYVAQLVDALSDVLRLARDNSEYLDRVFYPAGKVGGRHD